MVGNKSVHVIRHLVFEDLGSFASVLDEQGYRIKYYEAGVDDLRELALIQDDLLIILGGPISVNDNNKYPFLTDELALLEERMLNDKPTLGICLGAQLIAKTLGSSVYPGEIKEIGWSQLTLSDAGTDSSLSALVKCPVLHWHGETFDLPEGAQLLASTDKYNNQAFSYGQNTLALQFHPEVTAVGMEKWFIGHMGEIEQTSGISVAQLRADTASHAEKLKNQGMAFLRDWLSHIE